jgi:hypothetical protein
MLSKTARFVLLLATILLSFKSIAQFTYYSEATGDFSKRSGLSFKLGSTAFLGDLGGNQGAGKPFIKDFNSKTLRPFVGASYSYFPLSWLSVNAGLHLTWVTGADSLITNKIGHAAGRFERNLSFRSAITELSADVELYPLQTLFQFKETKIRPFLGTGIGLFHFNPKAHLFSEWFELQPLHLEGQGFAEYPDRKNYKRTQVYIPLSLGLKYKITDNYFFSLNTNFRKTFTDYIDDVSTTYIDPSLFDKYLSRYDAVIAKELYYRGTSTVKPSSSSIRGYNSLDSYTSIAFTITYLFDRSANYYFHKP